jgi:hypothetical protein
MLIFGKTFALFNTFFLSFMLEILLFLFNLLISLNVF